MFDFSVEPLRLFNIFPMSPFPLEVALYSLCSLSCDFCFSNLNRRSQSPELNTVNPTQRLLAQLRYVMDEEYNPVGYFLRQRYPICFSNTTDPFQRQEKQYRASETFLKWAQVMNQPVWIQTKGNVLLEEWSRYREILRPGISVVYLSITHSSEATRRIHEPGAISCEQRWELCEILSKHDIPVVVACNPYVPQWVPSPDSFCQLACDHGARGVWVYPLHLSRSQTDVLPLFYKTKADITHLANPPPFALVPMLQRFQEAAVHHHLDFCAGPQWDSWFRFPGRHADCLDPAFFNAAPLFTYTDRILRDVEKWHSADPDALIVLTWRAIAHALTAMGLPNVQLKVKPFWSPYYAPSGKPSLDPWKSRLGVRAGLHEILRYFFNHPEENTSFLWYSRRLLLRARREKPEGPLVGLTDTAADVYAVWNPRVSWMASPYMEEGAIQSWPGNIRMWSYPHGQSR